MDFISILHLVWVQHHHDPLTKKIRHILYRQKDFGWFILFTLFYFFAQMILQSCFHWQSKQNFQASKVCISQMWAKYEICRHLFQWGIIDYFASRRRFYNVDLWGSIKCATLHPLISLSWIGRHDTFFMLIFYFVDMFYFIWSDSSALFLVLFEFKFSKRRASTALM